MTPLNSTPGRLRWTKHPTTLIYFIREINGILLGIMAFITIICLILSGLTAMDINFTAHIIFSIFFIVSVIHSLTWFFALPKILPFNFSPQFQKITPIIFIIGWLAISFLLLKFFSF
jgi:fumarate reductase subunit C